MKIVVSGYVGKKITGVGRNLMCLLDASKSNNKYIIYTNYDMKDSMKCTNSNVIIKTYNISKQSSFKNLLWTTFVFPFVVVKEKADAALIPNFTLLMLKFRPTYVIMHDLIEFNIPDKFSKKKMFYRTKIANPITAKIANHIMTISENSKNDIMKYLGVKESKISIVYCGVNREKFTNIPDEKTDKIMRRNEWPEKFILYAGTIDHPGKNSMSLIRAFEKLKDEKKISEQLILAGMQGKGFEVVNEYVKKSKYKNDITITGYVTDEELIALYSKCSVFCFLSLYEGFGMPPLEALSCGAKIVVSNKSSLPEVVGNVGWIADPLNLKEISHCINEAIHFEKNAIYVKQVNQHLSKFDYSKSVKVFESIFLKKNN